MTDKLPISMYCCCKNGAEYLDKALSGVAFCDDKLFIDDSSTDNSIEIAKKHGCKIFHWRGKNSMGERRNYGVGFRGNKDHTPDWVSHPEMSKHYPQPKNDWIIQVDADEYILPESELIETISNRGGIECNERITRKVKTVDLMMDFLRFTSGAMPKYFPKPNKGFREKLGACHLTLHNVATGDNIPIKYGDGKSSKVLEYAMGGPRDEHDLPQYASFYNRMLDGLQKLQTMVPIPRVYHTNSVYWTEDVQNMDNLVGRTNRLPLPLQFDHYGYGDQEHHFDKQWARLPQLEERVREAPDDIHSMMYLICALAVITEGTNVPDFKRLQALVWVSIDDFINIGDSRHMRWIQITMQRILRHFWGACVSTKNYPLFRMYLSLVKQYMDYIPDVHYWEYQMAMIAKDMSGVIYHGEQFIKTLDDYFANVFNQMEITSAMEGGNVRMTLADAYRRVSIDALKSDDPNVRKQARAFIKRSKKHGRLSNA